MKSTLHRMGIDVGSTTAKVVILNPQGDVVFSAYRRHNAETVVTLQDILQGALQSLGNVKHRWRAGHQDERSLRWGDRGVH